MIQTVQLISRGLEELREGVAVELVQASQKAVLSDATVSIRVKVLEQRAKLLTYTALV
jgi:hypothetical protein